MISQGEIEYQIKKIIQYIINNIRYANPDNMTDYILGKKEILVLDQRQIEEEYIMLSLRMDEGIDLNDYKKQFGFDFKEKYFKQLEKLSKLKVIEITPNNLKIVSSYMGVMNSIITEFFNFKKPSKLYATVLFPSKKI